MISYELVKDFKKLYLKAILIKYRRCEGLRHVDIVERNKKAKGPLKKRDQRPLLFATRPSQDVLQYGMKKNSTVVQSARNDLQNWSHSQVMSSKLLLSVCRAPQDHKSTVWAIMQHLNYWDKWWAVCPDMLAFCCLYVYGKLTCVWTANCSSHCCSRVSLPTCPLAMPFLLLS